MPRLLTAVVAFALMASLAVVATSSEEAQKGKRKAPGIGSPEETLAQVQVPVGLKVEVWAAEPLLANVVSFAFDEKGRCFVAETDRAGSPRGVPDTRNHMYWLDDDLACRTVADRLAMYARQYPGHRPYAGYEKYADQLRLVWDSTGSGKADKSAVFSGGYNRPEDGIAAGVLARKGNVYFACIPDLYLLKDTKGANTADVKQSLSTGYGVRVQFYGHDMHGLRMGPDGKLYFSIGDRGLNVTGKDGKKVVNTESGAVLRCDPDGSNIEIVHVGLRNPQELSFDDFGNLFTFDNNSDSGDRARWVYVVEGGDSGWRCGYQYGTAFHAPGVPQGNRGPWNSEKIWYVPGPDGDPPAYVVPPLLHLGNGPSGITHYPGVGLADKYKDHFFACDFTSNPGSSVIWSLRFKPKGAGFEVAGTPEKFVQGMVPTDCEFGPDGAFYWSDWISGWGPTGKGRIFRVTDPEGMKNPAVAEAKKLLAEGFEKKTAEELAKLLEHPHQQVRLEAQYELAGRGKDAAVAKVLGAVASQSKNRLARLHAVWALGMIGRDTDVSAVGLLTLLSDPDAEVRAQVAKVIGSVKTPQNFGKGFVRELLARATADPEPRVRFFAAQSYGKWATVVPEPDITKPVLIEREPESRLYKPLFALLKANNDQDAYIRAAAVSAMVAMSTKPDQPFVGWKESGTEFDTPAVRLGVLLALRGLKSDKCVGFLADTDPRVFTEAARAIHDERVTDAMLKLAALADKSGQPDAIAYRALSACFKIGTPDAAARVAKFAARSSESNHTRVFALKLLADWTNPPRRDHVTGLIHDLPKRPENIAADALRPVIAAVFAGSGAVRSEAVRVVAKLGLKDVGPLMIAVVKDAKASAAARVEALHALAVLKDPAVTEMVAFALASPEPHLRAAGRAVKALTTPPDIRELVQIIGDPKASLVERQGAVAILCAQNTHESDGRLWSLLSATVEGGFPPEILLDVLEAAEARAIRKLEGNDFGRTIQTSLDAYRAAQERKATAKGGDKLAPWAETLAGGDPQKGRDIFLNNNAVYCQRCHKLDGQGGDVGPPLNGIAAEPGKDRRYLLESIVLPNAQIAKGFETVVLTLADGRTVSGVLKSDDKKQLKLMTAEAKELVIPVDEIESRRTGPSAMPDDLHKKLTRRELRDLVEFLASLKDKPKP
jgi:quinoprotein glucose dehydrogenase